MRVEATAAGSGETSSAGQSGEIAGLSTRSAAGGGGEERGGRDLNRFFGGRAPTAPDVSSPVRELDAPPTPDAAEGAERSPDRGGVEVERSAVEPPLFRLCRRCCCFLSRLG